jgi:hypothetical protein
MRAGPRNPNRGEARWDVRVHDDTGSRRHRVAAYAVSGRVDSCRKAPAPVPDLKELEPVEIIRAEDDVTSGFVINPNVTAQDRALSLRARGLHQLVRSLPPGFRITADEIAAKWCPEGRDAVRKAMKELVTANIVVKEKYQDERGRWNTRMRLFGKRQTPAATHGNPQVGPTTDFQASVKLPDPAAEETPGRTDDGFSGVGKPVVGKPGVIDNTQIKTRSIERPTDSAPPADWATELIAGLDYGKFRRPSRDQAAELAALVRSAHAEQGLTAAEIRRHCRVSLNQATRSGVAYLRGALAPEHLPVPAPESNEVGTAASGPNENARRAAQPAAADAFNAPGITFVPSRLRASVPLSVVTLAGTAEMATGGLSVPQICKNLSGG